MIPRTNRTMKPQPPFARSKTMKAAAAAKSSKSASKQTSSTSMQLGTSANLTFAVLPRTYFNTLKYAETFTLTTGAAGVIGTEQAMLLNSLYDPNFTGVGHQPYGFDQLSSFFNNYIVHRFRVKLLLSTIGGTAEVAFVYKLDAQGGGVALTGQSTDRATEAPMIGTAMVGPSGVDRAREIVVQGDCHKVLGVTKQQYRDNITQYSGSSAASPTTSPLLRFSVGSYSGTAGESLVCQCVIEFDSEFFNPFQMPQS